MRTWRPPRWLAPGLFVLGLALLGRGAWIPTKAWLAQHLIARAWAASIDPTGPSLNGGAPSPAGLRPWPWADTWPVARLRAPGHTPPLYVLAGASGEALAFGPAHVSASASPGSLDNVVLAGHRDTHFAFLRGLRVGDRLILETAKARRTYRVEATNVVHESRVDLLERSGRAELTLITCFPFDALVPGGPLRFVVHARGEPATPSSSEADPWARASRPGDGRRSRERSRRPECVP